MSCAVVQKLSQKQARLEGSTSSMETLVDMKRPYGQAERYQLYLMSYMGGQRCRFLPCSYNCRGVNNSGTVGEWILYVGGGMVAMLR